MYIEQYKNCLCGSPAKFNSIDLGDVCNCHFVIVILNTRFSDWYLEHDDVIKWKYFPRYWPFQRGIHRLPVGSPHKGQWRGALMLSFDLRLNKRLNKQWRRRWFETPSRSLWRHCNEHVPVLNRVNATRPHQSMINTDSGNRLASSARSH